MKSDDVRSDTGGSQSKTRTERSEFEFYVYEQDDEDPRFSFWVQHGDTGFCVYDRPPEGVGMWLKLERESDYEPSPPSEGLKHALGAVMNGGVDAEVVEALPPHERHFFQVVYGTTEEHPDAIPAPVWDFMHRCADEVSDSQ